MTPEPPAAPLSETDRRLLDLLQGAFPLEERPWRAAGERLGLDEADVLARVERLRRDGVVRWIGAIFDARALGRASALNAMAVPPERVETAAAAVNAHPGVSHNYLRDDPRFNLWFTLATPPECDAARHLDLLAGEAGATARLHLPALRVFKIGARFRLSGGGERQAPAPPARRGAPVAFGEREREAVRILQRDLPGVAAPFEALCAGGALAPEEVLAEARRFLEAGAMRRYAAVLRHRRAGFAANAMVVWRPAPEHVEAAGRALAAFEAVSHCYERPASPQWPWPLYTMVHARGEDALRAAIAALDEAADGAERRVLRSVKEFKKERPMHFTGAIRAWERERLGA